MTNLAQLLDHDERDLTNHETGCSQQIGAFQVGAIDELNAGVDGKACGEHGHEQHARGANDGVEELFHGVSLVLYCGKVRGPAFNPGKRFVVCVS